MAATKNRTRPNAAAQVRGEMDRRRSGAAGFHADQNSRRKGAAGRTNRVGSRSAQTRAAVNDNR